ncbi:MAG TPA: hypothetical protein VLI06_15590 [Solimonas sp.]|nr:hypothetical protein [Solimonas sp.]
MRVAIQALALLLCTTTLALAADAPPGCREVPKQGRTGGFISFKSEPHARQLLQVEANRYCMDLGDPAISAVNCTHDAAESRKITVEGRTDPLVVERRERWYCSGMVICSIPEKVCTP